MSNTSLTTASSPSALPAPSGVGTRNTSLDNPPYTVIQKNGVDVMDLADGIDLTAYPNTEEDQEHGVLLVKGSDWKKNGSDLIDKEPSAVDFITNCDVEETPSGSIRITDANIKKSGTLIKAGPKKINFLGDTLVSEEDGTVSVNLTGKGFFGDGSDGSYTLDGSQGSVSGLFTKGSAPTSKSIVSIRPINVISTPRAISGSFYPARGFHQTSLLEFTNKITVDIPMDSSLSSSDEGKTAEISCTYKDSSGNITTRTFFVIVDTVLSSSQFIAYTASPTDITTAISPYRTETVYSLSVNGKNSTANGTLLRPSKNYIALDDDGFTAEDEISYLSANINSLDYILYVDEFVDERTVTLEQVNFPERPLVSTHPLSSFTITYGNVLRRLVGGYIGEGVIIESYALNMIAQFGLKDESTALIQFSDSNPFTSDDFVKISGTSGVSGIDGVYRMVSLGANLGLLYGLTLDPEDVATGGTASGLTDYTLSRDAFFDSLIITDAARLCTNNYRLFVKDSLVINGIICNNGNVAGTTGYFPAMGTGANGGAGGLTQFPTPANGTAGSAGSSATNPLFDSSLDATSGKGGLGGSGGTAFGGAGRAGGNGAIGGARGTSTPITESFNTRFNFITGSCYSFSGTMFRVRTFGCAGGGGGGGVGGFYSVSYVGGVGGDGGRGGDNAGYLLISAGSMSGTGLITSIGGAGTEGVAGSSGAQVGRTDGDMSGSGGGGGGGGGGMGGLVILFSRFISSTIQTSTIGGVAGKGGILTVPTPFGVKAFFSGKDGYIGREGQTYEFIIT